MVRKKQVAKKPKQKSLGKTSSKIDVAAAKKQIAAAKAKREEAKKPKKVLKDKYKYVIGKTAKETKTRVHKTVRTESKPTKITKGGRVYNKSRKTVTRKKK